MLMQKVLEAAQGALAGKTIKDMVIGLSLISVELSDGSVGISYVLRESLNVDCSLFKKTINAFGKPAVEVAEWAITGEDDLIRGVGMAVLTAASNACVSLEDSCDEDLLGLNIGPDDTVGMIGYIRPVAEAIKERAKLIAFDEGLYRKGAYDIVYPSSEQPNLLPQCDIVLLSGTTTINGTIDALLDMCKNAREIVMVGPSTPMFKEGWKGSGLTGLAGALWVNSKKDELFRSISLGGGVRNIEHLMLKKMVRVH